MRLFLTVGVGLTDSGTVSDSGSSENGTVPETVTVPDSGAVRYIGTTPDNGTSGQWEWDCFRQWDFLLTMGLFLTM
jgi:hypothetical protein